MRYADPKGGFNEPGGLVVVFQDACAKAFKFAFPVIVSQRLGNGKCTGGIGAFVVLNEEGWIATCLHITEMIVQGAQSEANARQLEAEKDKINADGSLSNTQKRKKIDALPKLRPADVDRISVIWGVNSGGVQTTVQQFYGAPPIDLAIAKLTPFDAAWVSEYPKLKDPTKDFIPGAWLCRTGYPFPSRLRTAGGTSRSVQTCRSSV